MEGNSSTQSEQIQIGVSKPIPTTVTIEGIPFYISTPETKAGIIGYGTIQNVVPVHHILSLSKILDLKKTHHKYEECPGRDNGCSICWQIDRDEYWLQRNSK
jgi:hypothetical protein